jgi:hypothetical protein
MQSETEIIICHGLLQLFSKVFSNLAEGINRKKHFNFKLKSEEPLKNLKTSRGSCLGLDTIKEALKD